MIADFLQLVVNKTFKYNDYQDNKTAKLSSVKNTLKLKTTKIVTEPVFLSENYDDFVINNDTDLDFIDYNKINRLKIINVSMSVDFSKLKYLYKLTLYSSSTHTIFKNNCKHFKNIRFLKMNFQLVPCNYKKDFYNSIKNVYRFAIIGHSIDKNYVSILSNIHNIFMVDNISPNYLDDFGNKLHLLQNNYFLFVNGDITFENILCFAVKYIYCKSIYKSSIIVKKTQYDFTVRVYNF